jgi:hypothetical protein
MQAHADLAPAHSRAWEPEPLRRSVCPFWRSTVRGPSCWAVRRAGGKVGVGDLDLAGEGQTDAVPVVVVVASSTAIGTLASFELIGEPPSTRRSRPIRLGR